MNYTLFSWNALLKILISAIILLVLFILTPIIRKKQKLHGYYLISGFFCLYLGTILVLYTQGYQFHFSRYIGHIGSFRELLAAYNVTLHPFWRYPLFEERIILQYWQILTMHSASFLIFGLIAPVYFKRRKLLWVFVSSFAFSFLLELFQARFIQMCFDINDIVFNCIGALIGYLIYFLLSRLWSEQQSNS